MREQEEKTSPRPATHPVATPAGGAGAHKAFCDLILRSEDWLMDRILSYAKERNYTMYTSTLKEAWRLSIVGLSRSLVAALEMHQGIPELSPEEDYSDDPMSAFGVMEAQRHRQRGIDPAMFLGLFKYYKETYRDLVATADFSPERRRWCLKCVERFFDRVEIAFLNQWIHLKKEDLVTELQSRNRLLTNEKNKYLTIFESGPNPVILLDSDSRIDNLNTAAASLLNIRSVPGQAYYSALLLDTDIAAQPPEGMVKGRHIGEFFPPIAKEIASFAAGDRQEQSLDNKHVNPDGGPIYEAHVSKMLDVSFKFNGIVLTFIDVTAHYKIEEVLKTSQRELEQRVRQRTLELISANKGLEDEVRERKLAEDALRLVVEGTSFSLGEDFFYSLVQNIANAFHTPIVLAAELIDECQGACRTLAIWKDSGFEGNFEFSISGKPCEEVYANKDIAYYPEDVRKMFPSSEYMAQHSAEGYLGYPLFNSAGAVIGHLSLIDNKPIHQGKHLNSILKILAIRAGSELERKKAEREREALQKRLAHAEKLSFIGTFSSGVAHDLNNPLGIVLGFSQRLLKNRDVPRPVQSDLRIIAAESKRAADIVKNLLEISRKQKPAKHLLQINDVLRKTVEMQNYHGGGEGIKINLHCDDSMPPVMGNPNQLQQVFGNIIVNAFQSMRKARVRNGSLTMITKVMEDSACVMIYNDGPPIPGEIIDKVFDPFFTTKGDGEGTGLGLFVSHGIIEDHGGRITVENMKDRGVKFSLTLPLAASGQAGPAWTPGRRPGMRQGLKALVIDDETNLLEWFSRTLADADISVVTATNGKSAMELIENNDFDIIFSDIRMPKMDGLQLAKWAHTHRPEDIKKFVITTGVIDDNVREYCKLYGCEYLVKPFAEETILEMLSKIVEKG